MNLKTLLSEIDYGKDEIVTIFKRREPKIENIKFLWDELNKYKKELYNEEKSNTRDENINQKILNVIRVSAFIEEILLNAFEPIEYNFETRQTIDNTKSGYDFINDWTNINEILVVEDEILVMEDLLTEQSNLLDSGPAQTKKETNCFSKYCSIL